MTEGKPTIGRAIDQIIEALKGFEERDQKTILNTVYSHLQITPDSAPSARGKTVSASEIIQPLPINGDRQQEQTPNVDIRTLKDQKKPTSARQMVCLVAYYLQEVVPQEERKQSITTADVEKYFKQGNFKLPEALDQLLKDAKKSGYFESVGRGAYKLTRVGYNLVAHSMPGKEKA